MRLKIGVNRSISSIKDADIIIAMFDIAPPLVWKIEIF